MPQLLIDHFEGCSPLRKPCVSCRAMAFLRKELTPQELDEFMRIIDSARDNNTPDTTLGEKLWAEILTGLSVRTSNNLKFGNLVTINDVIERTQAQFLRDPRWSRRNVKELEDALATHGLQLSRK